MNETQHLSSQFESDLGQLRTAVLQMGGLVGHVVLDAAAAAPFLQFLRLAPWIGIGKGAAMVLGQVAAGTA